MTHPTLRRLATTQSGAGFPHENQGQAEGELPFYKVGDFGAPGNERFLLSCNNWVSRATARTLGAVIVPSGSVVMPKVGAALLGNARRITTRDSVIDNNVVAVIPRSLDCRFVHYWLSTIDLGQFANPGPVPSINEGPILDLRVSGDVLFKAGAVADFLDRETTRIDALIAAKRRMISVLAERRSSTVSWYFQHDPRSRPTVFKRLLKQSPCYGVLVPRFVDDGVPFIRVSDLTSVDHGDQPQLLIDRSLSAEYRRTIVQPGDVLLSVVGSIDKVAVVPAGLSGANVARAVCRLVPLESVPSRLLAHWLATPEYQNQAMLSTGSDTAQPTLNMGDLANFTLRFPDGHDADSVLGDIEHVIAPIDSAAEVLFTQIELLIERRQALITAAVTGELEIRGVAA